MFHHITLECPTSSLDQEAAAAAIECADTYLYHCMKDQKGQLGEICAVPSWIQAGYCPEYNTVASRIDAEDCDKTRGLCPMKTYLSNEVLSYSACLKRAEVPNISGSNTSTPNLFLTSQNSSLDGTDLFRTIFIPSVVLVFIIVLCTVVTICRKLRRKRNGDDKTARDEEYSLMSKKEEMQFTNLPNLNQWSLYIKAKEYIDRGESFLIVGTIGSGKTSICASLFNEFQRDTTTEKPMHCRFLREIQSLQSSISKQELNLIFLDDCFEPWMYMTGQDKTELDILQRVYFKYNTESKKKLIIVMTMDLVTWDKYKSNLEKITFFDNVLHLSNVDDEMQMACERILQGAGVDLVEKAKEDNFGCTNIIDFHNSNPRLHKFKITSFISIWKRNGPMNVGFPLSCLIFCTSRHLLKQEGEFFKKPLTSLKCEIRRLRDSNEESEAQEYLTLVYIMLIGELNLDSVDECLKNEFETDVMPSIKRFKSVSYQDSRNANVRRHLTLRADSTFLRRSEGNKHTFIHDIVFIAVFTEFGEWKLPFLLKHCKLEFLFKYIRLDEEDARSSPLRERTLLLSTNCYELWARHLVSVAEKNVKAHVSFKSERFKEDYESALKQLPTNPAGRSELCLSNSAE